MKCINYYELSISDMSLYDEQGENEVCVLWKTRDITDTELRQQTS